MTVVGKAVQFRSCREPSLQSEHPAGGIREFPAFATRNRSRSRT
jgi:hypothetical protein